MNNKLPKILNVLVPFLIIALAASMAFKEYNKNKQNDFQNLCDEFSEKISVHEFDNVDYQVKASDYDYQQENILLSFDIFNYDEVSEETIAQIFDTITNEFNLFDFGKFDIDELHIVIFDAVRKGEGVEGVGVDTLIIEK